MRLGTPDNCLVFMLLAPTSPIFPSARTAFVPTFSGHQTFVFRYPWLKKGVDALDKDAHIFRADDAIVRLGVGKNMVDSIRYWGLSTGVIEEIPGTTDRVKTLRVSDFGRRLLLDDGWDAYLEDDASLWLLHYRLVTNPLRATTWYFMFNRFSGAEFTKDGLRDALKRYADMQTGGKAKVSDASLDADVSCFVRTYLAGRRGLASTPEETFDCPLASLGLLVPIVRQKSEDNKKQATLYRFSNKPKPSLPASVFAYALADFWSKYHDHQETLSLREIVHGEGSPGRVFRLDEDAALAYLDALPLLTKGVMFFADTALIRQVVRRERVEPMTLLETYYANPA